MKNRECNGANQPPAWKDAAGRLWFPTIEGVTVVDPKHLAGNPLPPPVNLEQVVVDGRALSPQDGLTLAPGSRNLEFHYAAPSFVAPARVRYRYLLEGLDAEWVEAGPRRVAYYSRLPPGRYRFRVAAANDEGVWNETGASLSFDLRPRLYQTPWFYAVCGLALAGVVWGGDRLRVRRVRTREEALERLVEERTRALAEANLRLERLSSLDGLTGVANRRRFDEVLDLEWRRASRTGAPLSLVMLDVDFFKDFNDANGHLAGDEHLRQVAQRAGGNPRPSRGPRGPFRRRGVRRLAPGHGGGGCRSPGRAPSTERRSPRLAAQCIDGLAGGDRERGGRHRVRRGADLAGGPRGRGRRGPLPGQARRAEPRRAGQRLAQRYSRSWRRRAW